MLHAEEEERHGGSMMHDDVWRRDYQMPHYPIAPRRRPLIIFFSIITIQYYNNSSPLISQLHDNFAVAIISK